MAKSNGGIIGAINPTSFGKCTQTVTTASGNLTTQPGTQLLDILLVGGGGGGGNNQGGGGGGGGAQVFQSVPVTTNTSYPLIIGGGGSANACGVDSTGFSQTSGKGGKGGAGPVGNGASVPLGSGGGGSNCVRAVKALGVTLGKNSKNTEAEQVAALCSVRYLYFMKCSSAKTHLNGWVNNGQNELLKVIYG